MRDTSLIAAMSLEEGREEPTLEVIFSKESSSMTAYALDLFLEKTRQGVLPSGVFLSAWSMHAHMFIFSTHLHSTEKGMQL